ncbi:ABC transporter permease [Pseudoroseomonas globiformis]|uniref:ABC transporter permease n=1 Tax=Teichococcus globiformis TaxID=2307229 RepID=A0ABV7FZM2_9PROT
MLSGAGLAAMLWLLPRSGPLWLTVMPEVSRPVWTSQEWFSLLLQHVMLAVGAASIAAGIGFTIGVIATGRLGKPLRPLLDSLFSLAQAIPPVAVIALALPSLGFGVPPTLLALVLYSTLPVMRSVTAGLEAVPSHIIDAATGAGMSNRQVFIKVQLPLAMPVIQSGLRVSVTLAIATTAVGAVAGVNCLGTPIVTGLANGNPAWVLQGALVTAWLALLVDQCLAILLNRPGQAG